MAVNKPKGDNARKGAVKKRTQLKSKLGGATAWAKYSKTSDEFMASRSLPRKRRPLRNSKAFGVEVIGNVWPTVVAIRTAVLIGSSAWALLR